MRKNSKIDYSQAPVNHWHVYDRTTGATLYERYSWENETEQEYIDMKDWASQVRKERGEWIRSAETKEEMVRRLNTPDPWESDWVFHHGEVYLPNPYANDGCRRRVNLQKRLDKKCPLFADELYDRAMVEEEDYYTGNSEFDDRRAAFREELIDDYWTAVFFADVEAAKKNDESEKNEALPFDVASLGFLSHFNYATGRVDAFHLIARETSHFYTIRTRLGYEDRISKKTMRWSHEDINNSFRLVPSEELIRYAVDTEDGTALVSAPNEQLAIQVLEYRFLEVGECHVADPLKEVC